MRTWQHRLRRLIYDAFCGGFYFAALLYYIRCRSLYGRLNWIRGCLFLGFYVCAWTPKEMAVSLPVVLAAYELLYHAPKEWRTSATIRRAVADAGPALASVAVTMVFLMVKMFGRGSLMNAAEFR